MEAVLSSSKVYSSYLRFLRVTAKIRKRLRPLGKDVNRVYFPQRVAQYRAMWRAVAEEVGARFVELAADTWEIELNGRRTRIANHKLEFDNPVVLKMAGDKPLLHRLLKEAGLAVPEHDVFTLSELDRAFRFLSRHPKGCVIKPADGSAGLGVTTHVETISEVRHAAVLASLYGDEMLIEAQIPGECYRLLVVEGRMLHAVCRRGPRLSGDGTSTVSQLLRAYIERAGHPLKVDRNMLFTLDCQGLSLQSVPEAGRTIVVKTIPQEVDRFVELRTVYNATVTDSICESVRKSAEAAARVLRSDFVGVDIITPDPMVPLEQAGGIINEVNTTPALHHHFDSDNEKYPKVAMEVLSVLLRRSH